MKTNSDDTPRNLKTLKTVLFWGRNKTEIDPERR